MITSIRSINFSNNTNIPIQNNNKYNQALHSTTASCDRVSFSGKFNRLSGETIDLVQNFAKKLQVNKIYKFENPNVEKFQMTAIASGQNSETRTLLLQYSGYSKNNMAKYLMCSINDSGEIFEYGLPVKKQEEINIYEKILPALINHASKELKVKVKV